MECAWFPCRQIRSLTGRNGRPPIRLNSLSTSASQGAVWLCDEIMRDEDPSTSESFVRWNILTYLDREDFAGRRLLDFGSGCGASTMVLSRMFPQTRIVGVELVSESVEIARKRAEFYGVTDASGLPCLPIRAVCGRIGGDFDYVVLSAYMSICCRRKDNQSSPSSGRDCDTEACSSSSKLLTDGFPIESHTTVLPFINYLPDRMAHLVSRRFSHRVDPDISWTELLRAGIRGGTVREIVSILDGRGAELLSPSYDGATRDQIDLWYQHVVDSADGRKLLKRRLAMLILKGIKAVTGYGVESLSGSCFQEV